MKRCPECLRDYYDETQIYCLDDGSRLLEGPISRATDGTALMPHYSLPPELVTELFTSQPPSLVDRAPNNAIAVLPFLNLSGSEENEYFSDGLAEELLNVLSKIRGLRVAARTSAFSFKGKSTTVAEIGRILNVASVLEGSVRRANDRVRISVQLVKVEDGYQLWSESYDRTMEDIFAVQDDIAQAVVEEVRTRLLDEKRSELISKKVISDVTEAMKGRGTIAEAQRLMLLGRYFLDRTTHEDTTQAIRYFKNALDIDPDYALCWSELGRAYSIEAGRGWTPVDEGFRLSREAAERSLLLEPDLAEGHAQLGRILAVYDWDLAGAKQSYRRALELAPGNSSVLDGAGILAYKSGRIDDALALIRRVLQLDPLSAAFWHNLGLTCHAAGHLAEAKDAFGRALQIAPQRIVSRSLLALVLLDENRIEEAFEQAKAENDEFWRDWALAIIAYAAGENAESDELLVKLVNENSAGNAYQIAEVYAMRSENDRSIEWLERAIAERDPGVTHAKVNPRFRALYGDKRWPNVLSQIGF